MVTGVAVPFIAPRRQIAKGIIDTNTIVEMNCPNYSNALIFYTTDGSKPDNRVSRTINTRTHKYDRTGILLRQGKRTVKALCVLPDGRESRVVVKEFLVQWIPSESDEESEDENDFRETISQSRDVRSGSSFSTKFHESTRTVGNNILVNRISNTSRLPTTNTSVTSHPKVINNTKMNASSGPIAGTFETPYGAAQFDMPPQPRLNGNLLRCSGCGRVNNPDARFCDWCGTLPGRQETWETVPFPMKPKETSRVVRAVPTLVARNAGTQTVGLFYPGGPRVQKESNHLFETMERKNTALEKSKSVSATSPGGGKWNQQLEHINGHLKSYTQHNKEFREAVSEPRLGALTMADVTEFDEHVEVILSFPMLDTKSKKNKKDIVKKVGFGSTHFKEPEKTKNTKKEKEYQLPSEERILLNELNKKKCSLDKVEEMLTAGADPNVLDKDDTPAFAIAISNYHYEAAMLLLSIDTMNVHWKGGKDQNTYLHLVVEGSESPESIKVLRKLISLGSREKQNGKGFLPSDLARKYQYQTMLHELEGDHEKKRNSTRPTTPQSTTSGSRPISAASRAQSSGSNADRPTSARSTTSSTKSQRNNASLNSNRSKQSNNSKSPRPALLDDF